MRVTLVFSVVLILYISIMKRYVYVAWNMLMKETCINCTQDIQMLNRCFFY